MSLSVTPANEQEAALLADIDAARLPRHVAIIMDGNGRWAKQRRRPRIEGHRAGIQSVREAATLGREVGLEVLTLYAFSSENWRRPRAEVDALMMLLHKFLLDEIEEMRQNQIRLEVVGRPQDLPASVQKAIDRAKRETATGSERMILALALSYGSRTEIVEAAQELARRVRRGELEPDAIDAEAFAGALYTADLPDPDLLIRTSGEMRISNFLLWQIAYTELWVTPVLWPDFRRIHLLEAIRDYQQRERRFGGVTAAEPDGAL